LESTSAHSYDYGSAIFGLCGLRPGSGRPRWLVIILKILKNFFVIPLCTFSGKVEAVIVDPVAEVEYMANLRRELLALEKSVGVHKESPAVLFPNLGFFQQPIGHSPTPYATSTLPMYPGPFSTPFRSNLSNNYNFYHD
jgi:hypothetical protein